MRLPIHLFCAAVALACATGCGDFVETHYGLILEGNGYRIESPHRYPDTLVGTHFDTVTLGQTSDTHTFRLTNQTGATIEFTADPAVMIEGTEHDQFHLLTGLPDELEANTYAEFTVAFTPTRTGFSDAVMVIPYRPADTTHNPEALYVNIAGVGQADSSSTLSLSATAPSPALTILNEAGAAIPDGSVDPSPDLGTDLGTVNVGSSVSVGFLIENPTANTVELTGTPLVTVTGLDASEFTVDEQPVRSRLAPGEWLPVTVTFTPELAAERRAIVVISYAEGEAFMFVIAGTGATTG